VDLVLHFGFRYHEIVKYYLVTRETVYNSINDEISPIMDTLYSFGLITDDEYRVCDLLSAHYVYENIDFLICCIDIFRENINTGKIESKIVKDSDLKSKILAYLLESGGWETNARIAFNISPESYETDDWLYLKQDCSNATSILRREGSVLFQKCPYRGTWSHKARIS